MPWPTGGPKTWTAADLTVSDFNAYIRDTTREIWREINHTEFTSNVSVTATSEAGADTVVSSGAITYAATPILIVFQAVTWQHNTTGGDLSLVLFDGSTVVGRIWRHTDASLADAPQGSIHAEHRLTPTAASHTYLIKAYTNTGTATIGANAGGTDTSLPGFIRITQKGV